jgi:hypothetical protein
MRGKAGAVAASVIAAGSLLGAVGARAGTVPATARAAQSCSVGSGEGYGYTYLTSLNVSRVSCTFGRRLVRHKGHLAGWSCRRRILGRDAVQYDARMSCSSGRRHVIYTYTQNTR